MVFKPVDKPVFPGQSDDEIIRCFIVHDSIVPSGRSGAFFHPKIEKSVFPEQLGDDGYGVGPVLLEYPAVPGMIEFVQPGAKLDLVVPDIRHQRGAAHTQLGNFRHHTVYISLLYFIFGVAVGNTDG